MNQGLRDAGPGRPGLGAINHKQKNEAGCLIRLPAKRLLNYLKLCFKISSSGKTFWGTI